MINEVRQTVVSNFLEFARKAFKRMADEELEERFISVFKHQLEDLSLKDKNSWRQIPKTFLCRFRLLKS